MIKLRMGLALLAAGTAAITMIVGSPILRATGGFDGREEVQGAF